MWIKLLGCLLVVFAASALGFSKAAEFSARLNCLMDVQSALRRFEGEIAFTKTPILEVFTKLAKDSGGWVSKVFSDVVEQLKQCDGIPASEAWRTAVFRSKESMLKNEDIEIILDFGKCLGSTDVDGQLLNLSAVIAQLDRQMENARETRDKNQKLYRSLGVYAGILIAVLLL